MKYSVYPSAQRSAKASRILQAALLRIQTPSDEKGASDLLQQREFVCKCCETRRTFTKRKIVHVRHFAFSLVTGGLWLIVWMVLWFYNSMLPWTCNACYREKLELCEW